MNSIPVDLSRLAGLICIAAPEQRTTLDGAVRKDREGNTLWVTGIAVRRANSRRASVIDVQTAAEPVGVVEGIAVGLTELDASMWEIDGRHGLSYRAASVFPKPRAEPSRPVSASVPAASGRTSGKADA